MANDEVIGPRKTMFVLVIVVGCFAVLWPRILSPLVLGPSRDQLQPNQFDREAGCCEVIFETDVAVLELVNEVCNSALEVGKFSQSAAECRKAVNETCGVDIAVFLKRNENVGKTTKMLVETMQNSNSSCLREHFGVPVYSLGPHLAAKSWSFRDTLKQERAPPMQGMGPHPALRERGRAIPPGPPGPPPPPASKPIALPPHVRVRSPLSVYYEVEQPPPIPGMRPPLGSPGGPVPAPKSSMGFVMPIYTICIIVFFVYTLSKILFRRTASPYDSIAPDPQFRRRVFRDDSRSSPDKLVVTAISGLVAEVQQQMEASNAQSQQRQEMQDAARPYTNGTILLNTGPVQIVTSEYKEAMKEKTPEPDKKESTPEPKEKEPTKSKEPTPDPKVSIENNNATEIGNNAVTEGALLDLEEAIAELDDATSKIQKEDCVENEQVKETSPDAVEGDVDDIVNAEVKEELESTDAIEKSTKVACEELLNNERFTVIKRSSPEHLEDMKEKSIEALSAAETPAAFKVLGMELTAHPVDNSEWPRDLPSSPPPPHPHPHTQRPPHEAEEVKSIFLETEIPQQSRLLVAQFEEDREQSRDQPAPSKHAPLVVSGKMTLSLIQDAPRETPERDPESTMDEFTTASAVTLPAAEKGELESDEEVDEEIEVEEIEEEVEEEEEEEEEEEPPSPVKKVAGK